MLNFWEFNKNSRNPASLRKNIRFELFWVEQIGDWKHDKFGCERLRNFCSVLSCCRNSSSRFCHFVWFGHFVNIPWGSRNYWSRLLLAYIFCVVALFASTQQIMEEKTSNITDKRTGIVNDIISGIRTLKIYNWEDHFA